MAKILIVDDDPETRIALSALLDKDLGHSIEFASDGDAALVSYERIHPDLVITDLVMPEMHGVLFIDHLRAVDPDCKVIAISGKAPEHLKRAVQAGALASLQKPMERQELLEAVEKALASDPSDSGRT